MPSKSKVDVTRFIQVRVDEDVRLLAKMRREPSKARRRDARVLRKEIVLKIGRSADGMFMLAKLMLDEIKDMNKPELIRASLDTPPKGLSDMFDRVVTRLVAMGGFDKDDLNEILLWVACAKRDLYLGEVDHILKLRDLDQDGVVALEDELRTRFGSFFIVSEHANYRENSIDERFTGMPDDNDSEFTAVEQSKDAEEDTSSEGWSDTHSSDSASSTSDDELVPESFSATTVKFSHASIAQHFRSRGLYKGIGIDLALAQARILKMCLLFITDNIPKKNGMPWRRSGLLTYAADHLLDHLMDVDPTYLKRISVEEFNIISWEISALFREKKKMYHWLSAVSDEKKLMQQLFENRKVCATLQEWIPSPGAWGKLTRSVSRWLRNAKSSPQALLKPFAEIIIESWLEASSVDCIYAVLFLEGYMSMVSGRSFPHAQQ
jgi:hypothetical protein